MNPAAVLVMRSVIRAFLRTVHSPTDTTSARDKLALAVGILKAVDQLPDEDGGKTHLASLHGPEVLPDPLAWAVLWPDGGHQQHMMFPSESSALSWASAHPVACLGRVVPVYAGKVTTERVEMRWNAGGPL